jgi:hypothetical protein
MNKCERENGKPIQIFPIFKARRLQILPVNAFLNRFSGIEGLCSEVIERMIRKFELETITNFFQPGPQGRI